MFTVWKSCWGWCSCGVKVKTMSMVTEACLTAAASPLFLFFCVFPGLPFLSCFLCYYWKTKTQTKTMVDGDGGLNRGDRGSSPVFFFFFSCPRICSFFLCFFSVLSSDRLECVAGDE